MTGNGNSNNKKNWITFFHLFFSFYYLSFFFAICCFVFSHFYHFVYNFTFFSCCTDDVRCLFCVHFLYLHLPNQYWWWIKYMVHVFVFVFLFIFYMVVFHSSLFRLLFDLFLCFSSWIFLILILCVFCLWKLCCERRKTERIILY